MMFFKKCMVKLLKYIFPGNYHRSNYATISEVVGLTASLKKKKVV